LQKRNPQHRQVVIVVAEEVAEVHLVEIHAVEGVRREVLARRNRQIQMPKEVAQMQHANETESEQPQVLVIHASGNETIAMRRAIVQMAMTMTRIAVQMRTVTEMCLDSQMATITAERLQEIVCRRLLSGGK
jgi:hypothetical protein